MTKVTSYARRLWYLPALFLAFALALAAPSRMAAQVPDPLLDENASGTYFIVAFPDTTANALDSRYPNTRVRSEASLWIFSAVKNKVKITSNGGASTTLTLEAGKFKIYQIPGSIVVDVSGSPVSKSLKVESDYPIVMYCYWANIQSCEAWTPIPVEFWGTQYSAAAVAGEVVKEIGISGETEVPETPKPGNAEILVIAAYDNTTVTLTPPPGTNFDAGAPRTVTLNEGQVYQVQSRVIASDEAEGQEDIGGTTIVSDKPIGVLSGNTRVQIVVDEVGLKNNAYKNMLMEWLSPTEQHGKEFVYMGTWDSHRPGIGAKSERKREFVRVYNTFGKTMGGSYLQPGGVTQVPFSIKRDTLYEAVMGTPTATCFRTDDPAQALMHSSAIVQFNGSTPCFRGIPCLSYSAWAPYMVDLAPREQWPSFAPYYAPPNPGGMQHYINVVTDTLSMLKIVRENGSTFLFNRRIPGTDLIWGSMSVSQGEDHWLLGKDGAKFWGFVYGIAEGGEEYRPGRAKKKDGPSTAGGGGKESPAPLHPCEYEEYNAVSYGYPLAPTRRVLKPADSLQIDTVLDCWTLTIKIRAINPNPVGLRSVTLDPTSVKNAKLTPVDPLRLSDIIGRSQIELKVEPIDPLKNAEATVIIKDRTGKIWQLYYKYEAEYVTMNPSTEVNYGQVTLGSTESRTVTITNPLTRPLEVKEIRLAVGTQGYVITSTTPDGPARQPNPQAVTLQPGETITVDVAVTPMLENQEYVDTLKVILGCTRVPLPLITQTVKPIIYVGDLQFGTFVKDLDGPKTLPLEVCNIGGGELRFKHPTDNDPTHLLEWLASMGYTVDPVEIAKLQTTVLKKNECFTLQVTFDPNTVPVGLYRVVARYWASTRETRDTSVWTAQVVRPGGRLSDKDWDKQWLTAKAGINCTKNGTPLYDGMLYLTNTTGTSPARVKTIEMLGQDATDGFFRFDNSNPQELIKTGDEVRPGDTLRQRVQFLPTTERTYSAQVRIITEMNDTLLGLLSGTGIESHGSITGIKYDTVVYNNPYPGTPSQRRLVYVTAKPTRPLTITGIEVLGVDAGNFWVDPADLARLPKTLQPGETDSFYVEFRAQASGDRTATIVFKGDHSLCDDSTNTLTVYTFTRGVVTRGVDYGNVLTCEERDSMVVMTNTGTEPVTVENVVLDDRTTFFSIQVGSLPFELLPGESRSFPVHFEPGKVGTFTATVTFEVVGQDSLPVAAAPVTLRGVGYVLTVHAHIDRDYRGYPGTMVTTPIVLDEALDQAKVTKFFLGLLYNNKMMRVVNGSFDPEDIKEMLKGTIIEDWTLSIVESDAPEGEYLAVLTAPPGKFLQGTGAILNPRFQLYLGSVDSAKLNFHMLLVGKQCARVIPTPGLARIDSVCGLNLRLIESTGFSYTLEQNKPNPFNPTTDITFSLGLDGPTRMTVYDALGRKVATLVDQYMQPGTYAVTWDASTHPSGLYYYRLESGAWTRSSMMILRK
jgi:IgGFc binding protein